MGFEMSVSMHLKLTTQKQTANTKQYFWECQRIVGSKEADRVCDSETTCCQIFGNTDRINVSCDFCSQLFKSAK